MSTALRCALCAGLLALGLSLPALVEAQSSASAEARRPKVCLVLSGDGARGAAHVGVLKVLEELRVPIDCITGTSLGALVGAAYASGISVPEMEQLLASMSTTLLLYEKPPRQGQAIRRKLDDRLDYVGAESVCATGISSCPRAASRGQRIDRGGDVRHCRHFGGHVEGVDHVPDRD